MPLNRIERYGGDADRKAGLEDFVMNRHRGRDREDILVGRLWEC